LRALATKHFTTSTGKTYIKGCTQGSTDTYMYISPIGKKTNKQYIPQNQVV